MNDVFFYSEGPKIFSYTVTQIKHQLKSPEKHPSNTCMERVQHRFSNIWSTSVHRPKNYKILVKTFYSTNASHINISHAAGIGIGIFSLLYSGQITNDLAQLIFHQYMNIISKSKMQLKPELLPPTNTECTYKSLNGILPSDLDPVLP